MRRVTEYVQLSDSQNSTWNSSMILILPGERMKNKNWLNLGVFIIFVAEHVLYCLLFNNILDFLIVVDLVRLFFFFVFFLVGLHLCMYVAVQKYFTVVFHWISPSLLQIVVFLHLCIWFNWYHRRIAVTSAPSYIQMGGRAARWVARCRSKMYFFEVFNLFGPWLKRSI